MDRTKQQYGRCNHNCNYRSCGQPTMPCGCEKSCGQPTMPCDCDRTCGVVDNVTDGCVRPMPIQGHCGEETVCLDHESCPGTGRDRLAGMPLAMAYVPWQNFCNLYKECEAIYHGTIFADLDKDFYGVRCE